MSDSIKKKMGRPKGVKNYKTQEERELARKKCKERHKEYLREYVRRPEVKLKNIINQRNYLNRLKLAYREKIGEILIVEFSNIPQD